MSRLVTEKTHEPTPYRRQVARREGQSARSAEIVGAAVVGGFALCSPLFVEPIWQVSRQALREALTFTVVPANEVDVTSLFSSVVVAFGPVFAALAGAIFLLAVLANVAQFSVGWKPERLLPQTSRLNPVSRIGGWLSIYKLLLALSSVPRLLTTLAVVVVWIWNQRESLVKLSQTDDSELAYHLVTMGTEAILLATCCVAVWSGLDYVIHWRRLEKSLRMTPEEVRDEARRRDGDPLVRTKRRARHSELAVGITQAVPIDHQP